MNLVTPKAGAKHEFLFYNPASEELSIINDNANYLPFHWLQKRLFYQQMRGARKLMGENLKLVWAEFSTIS